MTCRKGNLLLGLVIVFAVLILQAGLGVMERGTLVNREKEHRLKSALDDARMAIDQFRRDHGTSTTGRRELLEATLDQGSALEVLTLLASDGYMAHNCVREVGSWRLVRNQLRNPSFEVDTGVRYPAVAVGAGWWQGNFTSGDGIPDGWQSTANGVEQYVTASASQYPASFVVSFWARVASPDVMLACDYDLPDGIGTDIPASAAVSATQWRRHYRSFELPATAAVRIRFHWVTASPGVVGEIDGVMLEHWEMPVGGAMSGCVPLPSAWTASVTVACALASPTQQVRLFDHLIGPSGGPPRKTWWTQW